MKTVTIPGSMLMLAAVSLLIRPGAALSQDTILASASEAELEEVPALKSESKATLLSMAGTVVPATVGTVLMYSGNDGGSGAGFGALLFSYGVLFGPATGYWYGGTSGQAWKGVGTRLGISLATTLAMAAICSGGGCNIFSGDDGAMTAATVVGIAGLGAIAASMIHDIAGVDDHVRRRNAAILAQQGTSRLTLAPMVSPADGGTVGVFGRLRL